MEYMGTKVWMLKKRKKEEKGLREKAEDLSVRFQASK